MTIFNVGSSSELLAALGKASAGDTVLLASGTYSNVDIRNVSFSTNVTIASQDASRPAILTDLMVRDSAGLNFRNLEFSANASEGMYGFQVLGSNNVHFDKLHVHGSLNDNPADDTSPFMIRVSSNVSVTNSEFEQLWHAVSFLDSQKILVENNSFHDLRTDGVRGGGTSEITIRNNSFTDFYPADGDHPDAIQFWTTGTTASAHDIVITGNVITRGDGEVAQGIFMRDQVGTLPYKNVTVSDNLVIGGLYNGIVATGDNVTVTNNRVFSYPDQKSWIGVQSNSATVSGNVSTTYLMNLVNTVPAGNSVTPTLTQAQIDLINAWQDGNSLINLSGSLSTLFNVGSVLLPGTITTPTTQPAPAPEPTPEPAPAPEPTGPVTIYGTSGADRLNVDGERETRIEAGAGNDVLTGGAMRNTLVGGTGDDTYIIKDTDDVVIELAGAGYDKVTSAVNYTLTDNVELLRLIEGATIGTGNALNNSISGTVAANILSGMSGNDRLEGREGDDKLYGGLGDDMVVGDVGNDRLEGGAGNDQLFGGDGNDVILGGDGNDQIEGGAGLDVLTGGLGADKFTYDWSELSPGTTYSTDHITDFRGSLGDRILLASIDANMLTTGVNDKFAFIGTQAFHKVAGELRYQVVNGSATVYGDVNGDARADFTIILDGVTSVRASDFML